MLGLAPSFGFLQGIFEKGYFHELLCQLALQNSHLLAI